MDIDPLPAHSPLLNFLILLSQSISFVAPPNWATWIVIIIIAGLCLLMSAFVSGSEIAYFGLTHNDIDSLREDSDNPRSQQAYNLISQSERLLATILICNNLVNIMLVVLLTFAISQTVHFHSSLVSFLIQTVVLTFLLLLFGEIFPKLVARGRIVAWARAAAPTLTLLFRLFAPMAGVMVRSTGIINRIVTKKRESISTDELERALEIADLKEGQDKEMLEGILSFGEKEVSDIMIARVDVTDIDITDSWGDVVEQVVKSGYSRIPVYEGTPDNVRGVLYSKDMLPYIGRRNDDFRWQVLVREPYFVPENRMIDDLLEDFRKRKIHIAIVIDEYGCTQGIVTLEDVIEEIVGAINDEYDEDEKLFKRLGPDTYLFEGKTPLGDFCRITGIEEEELGHADEAETLAGLILNLKGDFPKPNETLATPRCTFTVVSMERHRIMSVRVRVLPAEIVPESN